MNYESSKSSYNSGLLVTALNQSAYAHALAGTELEESLKHINEAFNIVGHEELGSLLDTRGYLHYLLGNQELALADMEKAVRLMERDYRSQQRLSQEAARPFVDRRPFEYQRRRLKEGMSVLYHHRGLVYQQAGKTEEAASDLARAEKMGYDPANGVW